MSDKDPGWIPMGYDFLPKLMRENQIKIARTREGSRWVYTAVDNQGRECPLYGDVQFSVSPWVCEDETCRTVWWDDEWDASKCPVCGCEVTS